MKHTVTIIALVLAVALLFSACGGGASGKDTSTGSPASSVTDSPADPAGTPVAAPESTPSPKPESTPEPEPEPEPVKIGDYELMFFLVTPEAFEVGKEMVSFAETIETETEGHVRFTIDSQTASSGTSPESFLTMGRECFSQYYRNAMKTEAYRKYLPDDGYAQFMDRRTLPLEAVTLPLQGFDNAVTTTKVLWELYRENQELADLIEEDYKILMMYASAPYISVVEERPPENEHFEYSRDVSGTVSIYYVCCRQNVWNKFPKKIQEIIESHSGYDPSIALAEMSQKSAEQTLQKWREEGLPEYMLIQGKTLLDPNDAIYAQYQAFFDDFAVQWAENVSKDTGLDAAAILARAKELYAGF